MEDMRLFGNMIGKLCKDKSVSYDYLCEELNCTKERFYAFLNGCAMPTFDQLNKLSKIFKLTPEELLAGDRDHYDATVVHCMNEFKNSKNREDILDIIEDYVKLASAV